MRAISSSGVNLSSSTLAPRLSRVGSLRCLAQRQAGENVIRQVRRSRHSGRGQSRARRCRIPDICERLGGRRALGCGDRPARAGERVPGLEVFGNRLLQQRALRVARVVEFGFGARWPTRVWMRVRWAG